MRAGEGGQDWLRQYMTSVCTCKRGGCAHKSCSSAPLKPMVFGAGEVPLALLPHHCGILGRRAAVRRLTQSCGLFSLEQGRSGAGRGLLNSQRWLIPRGICLATYASFFQYNTHSCTWLSGMLVMAVLEAFLQLYLYRESKLTAAPCPILIHSR